MDGLADLAELDEQLRRVGRDDEHIGVGLNEDAGLALVGVAHLLACFDGFGDASFKVGGVVDACAVQARAAEVGQAVRLGGLEAVDGFRQHQSEGVLARAARSSQDERLWKTLDGDALA